MLTIKPFDVKDKNIGYFVYWNKSCIGVFMASDLKKFLNEDANLIIDKLYDSIPLGEEE